MREEGFFVWSDGNVLELGSGHGEYTKHSIIHLQGDLNGQLCHVNFISIKVVLNKDHVVQ